MINMKSWIDEVIQEKQVTAVPIMTHPGIEMKGYTVREAVSNGKAHFEAIMEMTKAYPCAMATTIMDLTAEAECFGADIVFSDHAVPAVAGRLLKSVDDIEQLQVPSLQSGRIPAYLKANLLAAKAIADRPVLSGCIGPFSLAGRLYDMSELMILIYEQPEAAHLLLRKCNEFILKYCMALKATGSQGVMMAEPAAGLLSNEDCKQFSSPYVREVVQRVQDDHFIVVLHNCGNTGHCTEAMVTTGAAAYHFGNKCDMEEVTREVPPHVLSMGNIDPVSVLKDSVPEKIKAVVTDLLTKMKDYPNFVLSSGCDIPPQTPVENIRAFFEALDDYNQVPK